MTDTKATDLPFRITSFITISIIIFVIAYWITDYANRAEYRKACENTASDLGAHGETLITYR